MMKFHRVEDDGSISRIANPLMCQFGLTEVGIPLVAGLLTSAGVGAATAGTIASVATPMLIKAGVGAGVGELFGSPGKGATLGAIAGGIGPLGQALGMGANAIGLGSGAQGALNASAGASSPISVDDEGQSQLAPGGATAAQGATSGAGNPLAQISSKQSSGLSGPLAILAALAQNANRPSTTAPTGVTQNTPWNPTGYLNRTQNFNAPAGGSYYTYGQQAQQPFFNNNQLNLAPGHAQGGAITRAIAGGHYAQGGGAFSTGGGEHMVQGQGDGTSDSIPAKLSDGEYVLTAADVSRIGQGSTDAGVKKLDQMRQKIANDAGASRFQGRVKDPTQYLQKAS